MEYAWQLAAGDWLLAPGGRVQIGRRILK